MEMASEQTLKAIAASTNHGELVRQVWPLQVADKFRIAAMLLDADKPELAKAIGTRACQEIQLVHLPGTVFP